MYYDITQTTNLQPTKNCKASNSTNTYLVCAKLVQNKKALEDARATIRVAPERRQDYTRAARLFLNCSRIDASMTMVSMALDKLGEENTERRETLLSLQADIRNAQKQIESRRSDHFRKLPVEIFGEIVRMVIQHDPNLLLPLSHVSRVQTFPIKEQALKYICIQVKPRDSESSAVPPLDPGKIVFVRSKRN